MLRNPFWCGITFQRPPSNISIKINFFVYISQLVYIVYKTFLKRSPFSMVVAQVARGQSECTLYVVHIAADLKA
jgi:hypothetical protein